MLRTNDGTRNAQKIIQKALEKLTTPDALEKGETKEALVDFSLEAISYVSASKNGNDIPARAKERPELLWTTAADARSCSTNPRL